MRVLLIVSNLKLGKASVSGPLHTIGVTISSDRPAVSSGIPNHSVESMFMVSKRPLIHYFAVLAILGLNIATANAQRGGGQGLPKVGTALPEVTAYDADGKEFSTKQLRGKHAVLVFGCLT